MLANPTASKYIRPQRKIIVCCADANKPIANFAKSVLDKRSKAVKEHLSKLSIIGTTDYKELVNIVEQLDKMHRKAFEDFTGKQQQKPVVSSDVTDGESKKESIFEDTAN